MITIQQSAGQLNLANSDLLYLVTSPSSSQPQFQYVCAIKDGCGTTLTTIKQQPNPSSKGVFNLGRLIKQYLSYDNTQELFSMGTDGPFYKNTETAKFFKVAFGAEYSDSTTGSVTLYTGIGSNVGAPAQTGSNPYYYLVDGVVDPNSGDWNWISGSFYSPQVTPSSASFTKNVILSDAPRTQYAQDTDYLIGSVLNGNVSGSTTTAQDIYA